MIEVPNLDCMEKEDLKAFIEQCDSTMALLTELRVYAASKINAQLFRSVGKIDRAVMYEKICDEAYERLPESARW